MAGGPQALTGSTGTAPITGPLRWLVSLPPVSLALVSKLAFLEGLPCAGPTRITLLNRNRRYPHLADGKMEAQESRIIWPRPEKPVRVERGLEPRGVGLQPRGYSRTSPATVPHLWESMCWCPNSC